MARTSPRTAQAVFIALSGMANDGIRGPLRNWPEVTKLGAEFTYSLGTTAADIDKVGSMTVKELALLAASEPHKPGH